MLKIYLGMFAFGVVMVGVSWMIAELIKKELHLGKYRRPAPEPTDGEIWWNNLKRSPLSPEEAKDIADSVAMRYHYWATNDVNDPNVLVIFIKAECVVFEYAYRHPKSTEDRPQPRYFWYSHKLSCQRDREELADYILDAIRVKHPECRLYLDDDALILRKINL